MYSKVTLRLYGRERLRLCIRRARQSILFLALFLISIWGYCNYRADNFTFGWTDPVRVMLLVVVDPNTDLAGEARRGFLQRFLSSPLASSGNVAGVERWFQEEYERHTSASGRPIEFIVRGPIQAPAAPPPAPSAGASFLERWRGTQAFLDYFEELGRREKLVLEAYDVAVFVYFFDESETARYAGQHSVASRRNRRGVVFSPLGPNHIDRSCALLAHELCHTLGATDKYRGHESIFPDGFAEPDLRPPYPQERAEIMALAIPVAPGQERRIEELEDCVVGRKTAEEIGWRRSQR